MKRLFVIAGIVVGVLLLSAVLAPLFINVDAFRPELEKRLSAALSRSVHVGKLQASILSGGAVAENISIADDPAFNKGPFLQASSLKVGMRLLPLIFSHEFRVTSITVEKPEIVLLRNSAGKWNYSSLGAGPAKAAGATSSSSAPEFSVDKFEIVDGQVRIGQSSGHAARERVYQKVHLLARNISPNSAMPFTLTAATPGSGTVKLGGQAGPLNHEDSALTPLYAAVGLQHVDLGATGLLDPSSGLGGTLDFDGNMNSDGHHMHAEGKAKASGLKLVKGGTAAKAPVTLEYRSDYNLDSDSGTINASVHADGSTATATGTVDTHGQDAVARLRLLGKDMAVNDLAGLLPAFGVVLPAGAALQGGVANMDMTAEGPLDRLVITGPLSVTGTHLTGYNLNSKLGALAAFSGIKPSAETVIQTLSSGLRVAPDGVRADNILLDVPSIGSLTGNGVINSNNSLEFQMLLKLSTGSGSLLGTLGSLTGGGQSGGIPFLIQGTTSNPQFQPDFARGKGGLQNALLGGGGQNKQDNAQQQGLGGILGGLLQKKKKPQQ
jgi:AsmA protein